MTSHDPMSALSWFSTSSFGEPYMTLVHCMRSDWFWIDLMVIFKALIIVGYLEFARMQWKKYQMMKEKTEVARAYMTLILVFALCALCGYLWPIVRIFWPAYKLEVISNCLLALMTWRLVIKTKTTRFTDRIFEYSE